MHGIADAYPCKYYACMYNLALHHACMHACVHYILFAFCCIDDSECQEKRALMLIVLLLLKGNVAETLNQLKLSYTEMQLLTGLVTGPKLLCAVLSR